MDPKTVKLLIVDDEETIHRAIKRSLRREPYELLHAYDAAEAWGILEQHPEVGGILSDHCMPGTSGLDLLVRVRDEYPEMVTALITGQADLPLALAAINDGRVHRLFTKPWDAQQLRSDLRELVLGQAPMPGEGPATGASIDDELLPQRDEETGAFIIDENTLP